MKYNFLELSFLDLATKNKLFQNVFEDCQSTIFHSNMLVET